MDGEFHRIIIEEGEATLKPMVGEDQKLSKDELTKLFPEEDPPINYFVGKNKKFEKGINEVSSCIYDYRNDEFKYSLPIVNEYVRQDSKETLITINRLLVVEQPSPFVNKGKGKVSVPPLKSGAQPTSGAGFLPLGFLV